MSPVLFSVFLLSTLITHVIVEVSWLTLLIEAMLITMIYCLGFFLFSFSKKERDMFFQPLLKLLNR